MSDSLNLQLLEFQRNRHWVDRCNHDPDSYVGSFEIVRPSREAGKYDLYVLEQGICCRFGDDDADYIGLTNLLQVIELRNIDYLYQAIFDILLARGTLRWERKNDETI